MRLTFVALCLASLYAQTSYGIELGSNGEFVDAVNGLINSRAGTCGPPNNLSNPNAAGCCNKDGSKVKKDGSDDPAQAIGKLLGVEGPVHIHYHLAPAPKEKKAEDSADADAKKAADDKKKDKKPTAPTSPSDEPATKTAEDKAKEKAKVDKKVAKAVTKATKDASAAKK